MVAVKTGRTRVVEKLLESELASVMETLFVRDNKGSLPVHVAVHHCWAKITSMILARVGPDIFRYENAVGEIPFEMATVQWLNHVVRSAFKEGLNGIRDMRTYATWKITDPVDRQKLSLEVDLLKDLQRDLESEGKLMTNLDLKRALDSFVTYLSQKCEERDKTPQIPYAQKAVDVEKSDPTKTLEVVTTATPSPGRKLVHLIDVQNSVHYSLKSARNPSTSHYQDYRAARRRFKKETGLPEEVDEDAESEARLWSGILRFSNLRQYDGCDRTL